MRFLQSFDLGKGDYTKERSRCLNQSLEEIKGEIETEKSKGEGKKKL